ncbi:hypothetical protein [Paucilactobacillus kaifaensis]|uniref:hypothetical protein n=1 Tax=Paucilactobacillus kaifaensis TaxID=2559921 RepID=UPI0010F78F98|nr:hypothetical protein [Paucilactobacillus kaifaensis]
MVVKSRKVGNATVVTIPSSLNVPENTLFSPSMDENGNIILKRVRPLDEKENDNIEKFMDRFKPLMNKLKDK